MVERPTRSSRGGGKPSGDKWRYEPQKADDIKERANRTGGNFDSIFKSGFDTWRPKAGDNLIRFLPGTWGLGVHYAYDVWVHRFIGANDSTYLCPNKMLQKACPICAAWEDAVRAKDAEEAKALKPAEQRVAFIIDRDDDVKLHPVLFTMSWTMDRDILTLTHDKRRGTQLYIDDPGQGYDVTIKRFGTGLNTRYSGMAIDREPSPVAEKDKDVDKILDYLTDNQIPDILNFYDAKYLERVLSGAAGNTDELDDQVAGKDSKDKDDRDERARDKDDDDRSSTRRAHAEVDDRGDGDRGSRRSEAEADERGDGRIERPRRTGARDDDDRKRSDPEPEEREDRRERRGAEKDDRDDDRRSARSRDPEPPEEDRRSARVRDDDDRGERRRPAYDDEREDARTPRSNGHDGGTDDRRSARAGRDDPPFDEDAQPRRRDDDDAPARGRGREPDDDDRRAPRTSRR